MALDREIRALLSQAEAHEDSKTLLRQAHQMILEAKGSSGSVKNQSTVELPSELHIICAETAIKVGDTGLARESLQCFFLCDPPKNQFLCRAYLAQALIEEEKVASLRGNDAIKAVESAISSVLQAVNLAKADPRYHFLVYNASVIYWGLSRTLMRPVYRVNLIPSMEAITKALEDVNDANLDWRVRLLMQLAVCYDEADRRDDAAKAVNAALLLSSRISPLDANLENDLVRLQIHTNRGNVAVASKVRADILPSKPRLKASATMQLLKSGVVKDAASIEKEILDSAALVGGLETVKPSSQATPVADNTAVAGDLKKGKVPADSPAKGAKKDKDRDDKKDKEKDKGGERLGTAGGDKGAPGPGKKGSGAKASDTEATGKPQQEKVESTGPSPEDLDVEVVADIGVVALANGLTSIAGKCAERCSLSKSLTAKVFSVILKCGLNILALGPERDLLTNKMVQTRIDALRKLDHAMIMARGSKNPNTIEALCISMWNTALPLLQPNLRKNVTRIFETASDALEKINSLMNELRAQLHLEIAKNVQDTMLGKAVVEVNRALGLDYSLPNEEIHFLDRYLLPLQTKLRLKGNIYEEPEDIEEKALMQIERAKDAAERRLRESYLVRAVALVDALPDIIPPTTISMPVTPDQPSAARADGSKKGGEGKKGSAGSKEKDAAKDKDSKPKSTTPVGKKASDPKKGGSGKDKADAAGKDVAADRSVTPFGLVSGGISWKEERNNAIKRKAKDRLLLWADIAKTAWQMEIGNVTQEAAQHVLKHIWHPSADKDVVVPQAEVAFIYAESLVQNVLSQGSKLGDPNCTPEVLQMQSKAIEGFLYGMHLGLESGDDWLVANGCIYLYNYHLHLISSSDFLPLAQTFDDCFRAVMRIPTAVDPPFLCQLGNALACALEHKFLLRKLATTSLPTPSVGRSAVVTAPEASPARSAPSTAPEAADRGAAKEEPSYLSLRQSSGNVVEKDAPELLRAQEICESTMKAATQLPRRDPAMQAVVQTLTRVQRMLGKPAAAPTSDNDAQLATYLQLLALPFETPQQKKEYINKAMEVVRQEPDVGIDLQVRLAHEAYNVGDNAACVECLNRALPLAPPAINSKHKDDDANTSHHGSDSSPDTYRWLSIGQSLYGQTIARLVNPEKQEKSDQDKLRSEAIDHFVKACEFGCRAESSALVQNAAEHLWNTAVPFMGSPETRRLLLRPLEKVLGYLAEVQDSKAADLNFREALYQLTFDCYADTGKWEQGLKLAEAAFQAVPRSHHRALWKAKVKFAVKAGKPIQNELARTTEYDDKLQAKIWLELARASPSNLEVVQAYQKALSIFIDSPLDRVPILIEYGQWLFAHDLPQEDAEDQLLSAADILHDAEGAFAHREYTDDARSDVSASTIRTRITATQTHRPSSRGSVRSYAHHRTDGSHSRRHSRRRGVNAPRNRPQQQSPPPDAVALNVPQLLQLLRIHLVLARMARTTLTRTDYCLIAHHYVMRLWELCADSINPADGKSRPLLQLPTDLQGWLEFRVPDSARPYVRDNAGLTTLNHAAVAKPELLIPMLEELFELLDKAGYQMHCLPVLAMLEYAAEDLLASPSYVVLLRLRMSLLQEQLNLPVLSQKTYASVSSSLKISEEVKRKYGEEIRQREQLKQLLSAPHGSPTSPRRRNSVGGGSTVASQSTLPDVAHNSKPILKNWTREPFGFQAATRIHDREIWMQQAKLLMELGDFALANDLLLEAQLHAEAFDDKNCLKWCLHHLSRLACLEGDAPAAVQLEMQGRALGGDVNFWLETSVSLAEYFVEQFMYEEALTVLQEAEETFAAVAKKQNMALSAEVAGAICMHHRARLLLDLVLRHSHTHQRRLYDSHLSTAMELLDTVVYTLKRLGGGPELLSALLSEAQATAWKPGFPSLQGTVRAFNAALDNLKDAEDDALRILSEAKPSLLAPDISLPVARQLSKIKFIQGKVEMQLAFDEILLAEDQARRVPDVEFPIVEGRDGSTVARFVDPMSGVTPPPAPTMSRLDLALTSLTSAHALAVASRFQVEPLVQMGRCLRLLANKRGLLHSHFSDALLPPLPRGDSCTDDTSSVGGPNPQGNTTAASTRASTPATGHGRQHSVPSSKPTTPLPGAAPTENRRLSTVGAITALPEVSAVTQAIEVLQRAVELAKKEENWPMVAHASLELVDCYGYADPLQSVRWLVLAQSATAREYASSLLKAAGGPHDRERLLMLQREHIFSSYLNPLNCERLRQHVSFLSTTSPSWKRLSSVSAPLQDILTALPLDLKIVVLHLSPDRAFIYAAYLSRDQASTSLAQDSFIVRVPAAQVLGVLDRLTEWKASLRRAMEKKQAKPSLPVSSTQTAPASQAQVPPPSATPPPEKDFKDGAKPHPTVNTSRPTTPGSVLPNPEGDERLDEEFNALLTLLDTSLSQLLTRVQAGLVASGPSKLLIVPDHALAELPLEALAAFRRARGTSRDISLHFFYSRLQLLPAAKPVIKKSSFSYLADPRGQDLTYSSGTPRSLSEELRADILPSFPFTKDWVGQIGSPSSFPGPSDWQLLVLKAASFLFYGYGTFLATIPPLAISPVSLSSLTLAFLVDRADSEESRSREQQLEQRILPTQKLLYTPHGTATLLSLRGVASLALNQFATSAEWNRRLLVGTLQYLASGYPLCEAIRCSLQTPLMPGTAPAPRQAASMKGKPSQNKRSSTSDARTPGGKPTSAAPKGTGGQGSHRQDLTPTGQAAAQKGGLLDTVSPAPDDDPQPDASICPYIYNPVVYGLHHLVFE